MDDPWPFALSKARIGSLVQRRPFIGVQGAPMYPPHYGFIVDVTLIENQAASVKEYEYEVVFILRDGNFKRSTHYEEDLILINV
tara:strand:+ start:1585 stop:1836 length:252 start_codon:yes stop_codon:yes gene_type:complete